MARPSHVATEGYLLILTTCQVLIGNVNNSTRFSGTKSANKVKKSTDAGGLGHSGWVSGPRGFRSVRAPGADWSSGAPSDDPISTHGTP